MTGRVLLSLLGYHVDERTVFLVEISDSLFVAQFFLSNQECIVNDSNARSIEQWLIVL